MSAPVSVVIPTREAAGRIGPCLARLAEGAFAGLVREVILVDAGSADAGDLAAIAEAVGARMIAAAPGRGPQLAAGAAAARGDWLLFLHADTHPGPGWVGAIERHIAARPDRAGYFRLAFDSDAAMAGLVARWANLRSRLLALPYGDQGLLIRRALYDWAGGYPAIPIMEDVALVRRLGRRRIAQLGAVAVTDAERYRAEGWLRRGWRNLTTLGLYILGVAPERLVRRYGRRR